MKAYIFDLDGVLVDSAKYHYLAWKALADKLGFVFTEKDNERLKGVSRMKSLEILLEIGNIKMSEEEKEKAAEEKNNLYRDYISKMTPSEILPGVENFLKEIKALGKKTAIGSASKNTPLILEKTGLDKYFNAVADGTIITKAKPDPEVFLKGAEMLNVDPKDCIVFEDAVSGVQAAHNAGMKAVGVGDKSVLTMADLVIKSFEGFSLKCLETI
ncbi:MAG: beta-phosphoglucomutase [Bacteroidales bacterium]|nr:beta-phosphoglucomutase [Bacteroidales bacterium]